MPHKQPPDLLVASTAAQAKALAHPTRARLLLELGDGSTVSRLATRLAINKGNVAHHLGVLVAAGFVRKDRTRTVRGGTEQYYVKVAQRIAFESEFGPEGTVAMMQNLTADLVRDPSALLNHRILRLTERQAAALAAHLDQFVHDLEPAGEREQTYGVVVGVYRRDRPGRVGGAR